MGVNLTIDLPVTQLAMSQNSPTINQASPPRLVVREPLIKLIERSLARSISNLRGEGFSLKNRVFQRFLR